MPVNPIDVFGDSLPDLLNRMIPEAEEVKEELRDDAKIIANMCRGKPFYYAEIAADKSGLSYYDYWNNKALETMYRWQKKTDDKYEETRWEEAYDYAQNVRIEDVTKHLFPHGSYKHGCPCPFHKNKSRSFFIYPATNSFYCFGCGKGGTPIDYVMEKENLDFKETINYISN